MGRETSQEELIEKAKLFAQEWNTFRESWTGVFSITDFRKKAKEKKLPYVTHTVQILINEGVIIKKDWGTYQFVKDKPLHYSGILKMLEHQKEIDAARRNMKTYKEATHQDVIQKKDIKLFTDEELAQELRRRGFELTANKIIEL